MTSDMLVELLMQSAVAGGGAWLAVKVELKFLAASLQDVRRSAERSHARIDDLIRQHLKDHP